MTDKKRIPISGPSITEREIRYVADACATAWYENANVYNARFEQAFAAYVGSRFAISLPSCTAGLHLSLAAMGVGPGDEVIVPDATWIASAAPISYVGATPVFGDVDPATWCLSAASFERLITPRTKAVIPVDLYGGMADFATIRAIADRHGVRVIEDAAEALGSEFQGRKAGHLGDTGTFSFHGSKTMTTGEGGMVVTDDEALHRRMLVLRDHGRQPNDTNFFNGEVAFKYKMTSLQAALGLAQIERVEELVSRKRAIFAAYRDRLGSRDDIVLNAEPAGTRNSYWMVTVAWDAAYGLSKDAVMARLKDEAIDTRPFFHPLTSLPAYREAADQARAARENKVAYDIGARAINLPCGMSLEDADIDYVCDKLVALLDGARMPARRANVG
ncbi:MAG TPA: DegT/DnrJ/EryC1/StrS family aminotransferase [Alphaproteobacteria bacterium]|jgi:perosamine synthetase